MRARYYDATTARFLSREPLWPMLDDPMMLNPYQYALSNPIHFVDYTGREPVYAKYMPRWEAYHRKQFDEELAQLNEWLGPLGQVTFEVGFDRKGRPYPEFHYDEDLMRLEGSGIRVLAFTKKWMDIYWKGDSANPDENIYRNWAEAEWGSLFATRKQALNLIGKRRVVLEKLVRRFEQLEKAIDARNASTDKRLAELNRILDERNWTKEEDEEWSRLRLRRHVGGDILGNANRTAEQFYIGQLTREQVLNNINVEHLLQQFDAEVSRFENEFYQR
jgi:hypothetical protein